MENLAESVDSLYEEPQDCEFAAYFCPQEEDLQFSEYIDEEEVPIDNSQVSVCESAPSMKRQYDGDDVFNVLATKFKKADVVDCEVNQNLADMINFPLFRKVFMMICMQSLLKTFIDQKTVSP